MSQLKQPASFFPYFINKTYKQQWQLLVDPPSCWGERWANIAVRISYQKLLKPVGFLDHLILEAKTKKKQKALGSPLRSRTSPLGLEILSVPKSWSSNQFRSQKLNVEDDASQNRAMMDPQKKGGKSLHRCMYYTYFTLLLLVWFVDSLVQFNSYTFMDPSLLIQESCICSVFNGGGSG